MKIPWTPDKFKINDEKGCEMIGWFLEVIHLSCRVIHWERGHIGL